MLNHFSELYSWSGAFIDCIPRVKSAAVTIPDKDKLSLQLKSKRPEVTVNCQSPCHTGLS